MKLLHTSDWHLGQLFKNRSREAEHKEFLDWLLETIGQYDIDLLIVSGDIFDTLNPPKYALSLYHNFLVDTISKTKCKNIIIIAGNHDSVATLQITQKFAKALGIHIVATIQDINQAIIPIKINNQLQAIVCAIPFLRDNVLLDANKTQTNDAIQEQYNQAMKQYYQIAYNKAKAISQDVPIIATGHFATIGTTINQDSQKDIYIGNLSHINSDILEPFDYVAMGHIHKEQKISNKNHIRYCGSVIPLGFSETNQQKHILIANFAQNKLEIIDKITIPRFRQIYSFKDSFEAIKQKLQTIANKQNRPFVQIIIIDDILDIDINEFIKLSYENGVDIVEFKKEQKITNKVLVEEEQIKLEQLDIDVVFQKRLKMESNLSAQMKKDLTNKYMQIQKELQDEDYQSNDL